MRQIHTSLAEKLANNGYVVIAMDHSYDANITIFPDGSVADYRSEITGHPDSIAIRRKQINTRAADISFIIDRLAQIQTGKIKHPLNGYLDLNKIGVTGHSFGGGTSTLASYRDNRIKATSVMDSWMNSDSPLFTPFAEYILDVGALDHQRSVYLINQLSLEFFDQYLLEKTSPMLNKKQRIPEFIIH